MASETILSSLSCERLVVENSGKIAKNRRSKNSSGASKYSRHKEQQQRNRSPARIVYDCSDDSEIERCPQDEKNDKRMQDQQQHPKFTASSGGTGYSSSEEVSDRETSTSGAMIRHRRRFPTKRDQMTCSSPKTVDEPVTQHSDRSDWELVDNYRANDNIDECVAAGGTTTDPQSTEDEFWKCETGDSKNAAASKKPKKKKNSGRDDSAVVQSKVGGFLAAISPKNTRMAWLQWKLFVEEHRDQLTQIRLARNKCVLEFVLIFVYCGIGGIIFHSVEGAFETFYKCGVKRVKRDFLDTLWSKSHYLREDDWKSLARSKLMEFENQLYDAYEAGMTSYSGQKNWSFLNSFVYSITVVSTIGYGHIAPVTPLGRIITIIYSLFGIPLFLILLTDYGKLFTRVIKFFWAYVRTLYRTVSTQNHESARGVKSISRATQSQKSSDNNTPPASISTEDSNLCTIDDEFNIPISLAISVLFLYTISGAALFAKLEGWPLFHSFYYVYISVSTIGFGDIVPSSKISVLLCSLVYFVFGLSLTSMCLNAITERLTSSFRQATAKIGATLGVQIAEINENFIATDNVGSCE